MPNWKRKLTDWHSKIVEAVDEAQVNPNPKGWKLVTVFAVGGLHAVGFEENSENLLVVSSNGQSVFDCLTGIQLYRNRENNGYDSQKLKAHRLDDANSSPIRMAGLQGGGLRTLTDDGWSLTLVHSSWPQGRLLLQEPNETLFSQEDFIRGKTVLAEEYEFRVWGFSWTGQVMIWSNEVDIFVYRRELES